MAVAIVTLSRKIDRDFRWLTVQIERGAGSVPVNIVEGHDRLSLREYLHHLSIARSSLAETEYWLHFSTRLGLLSAEQVAEVSPLIDGAGNLLYGLIRHWHVASTREPLGQTHMRFAKPMTGRMISMTSICRTSTHNAESSTLNPRPSTLP
jgi:four helix bundle protein